MTYEDFGAQRPNPEFLHVAITRGERREAPFEALKAAHACTDMAFHEPEQAPAWIDKSEAFCTEATRRAVLAENPLRIGRGDGLVAIEAALHKATLPNWLAAAESKPVAHNYPQLVKAATDTLWIGKRYALTKFMEFMPVLLGARMLARGSNRGWIGRMALIREGHGAMQARTNPNWDCGIAFDNTPDSFVDPLHLEIKMGKKGTDASYAAAGTIVVKASVTGIAEPAPIVLGCAKELGIFDSIAHPDMFSDAQILYTQELNARAGTLRNQMHNYSQRFGFAVEIPRRFHN